MRGVDKTTNIKRSACGFEQLSEAKFWKHEYLIFETLPNIYILPIMYFPLIAYRLLIDCPLSAHMISQNEYGPGTKAQGQKLRSPRPRTQQLLGLGPWTPAHIHYG